MYPLRIVFMGTPEFALPALRSLNQFHEVIEVYTRPDQPTGRGLFLQNSPVKKLALELGLPISQPKKLTEPSTLSKLQILNPDLIVVAAYGQILKKEILAIPKIGCINIHSSLLPRWRGASPIQSAILAGDQETGITIMYMSEKLDAGNILLQEKTSILKQDNFYSLHSRLSEIGGEQIILALQAIQSGKIAKGEPQNETQVTYAVKLSKEMQGINPLLPAIALERQIRAFDPWPGSCIWLQINQKKSEKVRLKIKSALVVPKQLGNPGELFWLENRLLLGTAQDCLELIKVQWEGKKEMKAIEFLNGLQGKGQQLPLKVHH